MGMSLMLRWGKGSLQLTCTGASGAPKTPSNNLRSDRWDADAEAEATETDGALHNWPFIHRPHLSILESPPSAPSGSGPSINGDRASGGGGLTLPDLETNISGGAAWCVSPLRRRRRPDPGETLLDLLRPLDLAGESPLTISEKNPCFFSISRATVAELERENNKKKNAG